MPRFQSRLNELKRYDGLLRAQFIETLPDDPAVIFTGDEELQIKGYFILLHAAMEEFVEQTVLEIVNWHCHEWRRRKRMHPTIVLLALLGHMGEKFSEPELSISKTVIVKPSIEERIGVARATFQRTVDSNQGVSLAHIKRLARPAAIEVDLDPDTESALAKLKTYRGEYAHKGQITTIPSATEIIEIAEACLGLCEDIARQAVTLC